MQMRFISTRSRAKEVVKHTNNANWGAHKQGQMRFLSTRTNENDVPENDVTKNKYNGKII